MQKWKLLVIVVAAASIGCGPDARSGRSGCTEEPCADRSDPRFVGSDDPGASPRAGSDAPAEPPPVARDGDPTCTAGQVTCQSLHAVQICDAAGSLTVEPCADGEVCELGQCKSPSCDPGAPPICDETGQRVRCNSLGTALVPLPCPAGTGCLEGECAPAQPNVLLLVDTSLSMNAVVEKGVWPWDCTGAGCPAWEYPNCDNPLAPATRLGRVKQALMTLLDSDAAENARLALLRFPQRLDGSPECDTGYYFPKDAISGDDDAHTTADGGWFTQGLHEVVSVPFRADTESNVEAIAAWLDFTESVGPSGPACVNSWDCASGLCAGGHCQAHDDPELRGMGTTPLGKSLFYAGEYLRHFVLVEGKPCGATSDCASPHHTCVDGACHDPMGACRPTTIVLLTDGGESRNIELSDFFHPRVQAKRLHYGLGCADAEDCVGGALCIGGTCRPPAGEVPETAKACEVHDLACGSDADCPAISCGFLKTCPGTCSPAAVLGGDPNGADVLTDYAGDPVSVTVHVVDASGVEGANGLIAAYGGGEHVSVDLGDISDLIDHVLPLLDPKSTGAACIP